jgi:two-component system, OmpR family, sensor kinase
VPFDPVCPGETSTGSIAATVEKIGRIQKGNRSMAEDEKKEKGIGMQSPEPLADGFFKEIDVAFLVHELKDPVAVIEAGIRTLLERPESFGPLSQRQERTLRRTLANSRKARSLLNELLEVGRGEAGCFITEVFRPAEAIFTALMEAVETFSGDLSELFAPEQTREQIMAVLERENIFFEVSPNAAAVELLQDQRKLQHIVGNLIKNALYHRRKRVDIKLSVGTKGLAVEVGDDGPGVPASFQNEIFQRYTQAAPCSGLARNGHGLGLAGARALARCLGGDIHLKSGRGSGAVFKFEMPISK